MSVGAIKEVTIWEPQQGPQTWLINCRIPDAFLGGGRGGGKTDSLLGDWLNHVIQNGPNANGILFRKRYKQFEEIIRRAKEIYLPLGGDLEDVVAFVHVAARGATEAQAS